MNNLFNDDHRALQDRFESRRLADRLEQTTVFEVVRGRNKRVIETYIFSSGAINIVLLVSSFSLSWACGPPFVKAKPAASLRASAGGVPNLPPLRSVQVG